MAEFAHGGPEFNGKDEDVLKVIGDEGLSVFTFDGLRRITGSHPETLSRTLDRLEENGLVVRSPDGYVLTGKGRGSARLRQAADAGGRVPILHTFLPHGASPRTIASALKGRWFDRMRWVGMAESEEGVVMKWVTEDGTAMIDLKMSSGQLDVEAKLADGEGLAEAVRAAHQLMGRVSKLYSSQRPGGRHLLMQIGYFTPYAM